MTITTIALLKCDGKPAADVRCRADVFADSPKEAFAKAKKEGWILVNHNVVQPVHYCPQCVAEMRRTEAKDAF